jgi:hypothetical protein
MVVFVDPLACGERLEESPVEPPSGAIIHVLDGGGLMELGGGQAARKATIVSKGRFPVDEQAEPFGMRHLSQLRPAAHPGGFCFAATY